MAKRRAKKKFPDPSKFKGTFNPSGFWFQDDRPIMRAVPFSSILPQIIARYGITRRLGVRKFEESWRFICQNILTSIFDKNRPYDRYVRLVGFSRGTVRIEVADNMLLQELTFYKAAIVAEFQSRLPAEKIVGIKLSVNHHIQED